jgi:hypothetical protein
MYHSAFLGFYPLALHGEVEFQIVAFVEPINRLAGAVLDACWRADSLA